MELRGMHLKNFINWIWSEEIYNFVSIHYFSVLALSEIVGINEDVLSSTEKLPVFVLKDLVKMYEEILLDLGANEEFIRKVHGTKLKESTMKHVSCL